MIEKQIRADLRPAFYDDFHCLAAKCRSSCCVGWHITFNKKDYLSLKRQSGSADLNVRMADGLRRIRKGPLTIHYGEFTMKGGRCPLLREDCLCALQIEKGHEALPYVCRSFPRAEIFRPSGYLERSLSPACEGVLALLWNLNDGVEFRSDPLPKDKWGSASFSLDHSLAEHFQDIRSQCIDILQDRRHPLPQRILLLGLALKELTVENVDVVHWPAYVQSLSEQVGELSNLTSDNTLPMFLSNHLRLLFSLPNVDRQFSTIRAEIAQSMQIQIQSDTSLAIIPTEPYLIARTRFQETFPNGECFLENLMVALFFHLCLPDLASSERVWKSYVNFCNLYSFYRFMAVMSCREGASGDRDELFHLLVFSSRNLIHNNVQQTTLRDEFFKNDSATLAHMAILVNG